MEIISWLPEGREEWQGIFFQNQTNLSLFILFSQWKRASRSFWWEVKMRNFSLVPLFSLPSLELDEGWNSCYLCFQIRPKAKEWEEDRKMFSSSGLILHFFLRFFQTLSFCLLSFSVIQVALFFLFSPSSFICYSFCRNGFLLRFGFPSLSRDLVTFFKADENIYSL